MSNSLVEELIARHFSVVSGELAIGGHKASQLLSEHGSPLFVYDAGIQRTLLANLREALPSRVDVHFSVKANPNPAVVKVFVDAGTGTEIASAGEYEVARRAGCEPSRILFAGPAKGKDEIAHVIAGGVGEIHLESDEEIAIVARCAREAGRAVDVSLRINPSEAGTGGAMRMGGQPAAFGFDEERMAEVVRLVLQHEGLRLRGMHMFAGTQILDAEVLVRQWRHAMRIARSLADMSSEMSGRSVETIDLGGGLGIPLFANDKSLDLGQLRGLAASAFEELASDGPLAGTRFVVEPGRHLVGPAGVYLTTVRAVKESRGSRFVICDGGMNHHLAASGNLGTVIKKDYPIVNASRVGAQSTRPSFVVGPLCTPLDTIGRKVALPDATQPGDVIAILQSGAYGLTASPFGFLGHPMPAEVLVDGASARAAKRIRERGTFAHPLMPPTG